MNGSTLHGANNPAAVIPRPSSFICLTSSADAVRCDKSDTDTLPLWGEKDKGNNRTEATFPDSAENNGILDNLLSEIINRVSFSSFT